jgi:hypothetical protein
MPIEVAISAGCHLNTWLCINGPSLRPSEIDSHEARSPRSSSSRRKLSRTRSFGAPGLSLSCPRGTRSGTSAGKYGVGPAIVGLIMPRTIVTGLLVTQMFSYAGNQKKPNISALLIQPFFNYNLKSWAIFVGSSGITANWELTPSGRWLVPVGTGHRQDVSSQRTGDAAGHLLLR